MARVLIGPDHYRYYTYIGPNGVEIRCERYVVVGETPLYWYVVRESMAYLVTRNSEHARESLKKLRKRVLKASHGKRYCYPDKARALHSFQQRQQWRIIHAKRNLETAQASLKAIERILSAEQPIPDNLNAGHTEYASGLNWYDY